MITVNARWVWLTLYVLVAGVVWSLTQQGIVGDNFRFVWSLTSVTSLAVIAVAAFATRLPWLSAPVAFMTVIWIFHFGLVAVAACTPAVLESMPFWSREWLYDANTIRALQVSVLFTIAFAFGVTVQAHRQSPASKNDRHAFPELQYLGYLALGAGFLIATIGLREFGFGAFSRSYEDFFSIHSVFSWSVALMGYGVVLLLAGRASTAAVLMSSAVSYVPMAVLVFSAGARSAPLVTAIVILIAIHKRGFTVRLWAICALAAATLTITSVVKDARTGGVQKVIRGEQSLENIGPLQGLLELGASLRPVTATVDYVDRNGLYLGSTYMLPFARQAERVLRVNRGTEFDDNRFVASLINQEYGSIGYSAVAEAYANGSVPGVIVIGAIFGIIVTWFDQRSRNPYGLAVLGAVSIPLLLMVRNSFVFVPGWLALGLLPLRLIRWLATRPTRVLVTNCTKISPSAEVSSPC